MAANFAGVLGMVSFFAEMARGIVHGSGLEGTMPGALLGLFGFAALGFVLGGMADAVLREAVQQMVAKEMERVATKT